MSQTYPHPQEFAYQFAARTIFLVDEFFRINDNFVRRNIVLLPLKGIALTQYIYPDPTKRFIGDIDILVKPQDCLAAREALEQAGYRCERFGFFPQKPYSIFLNSAVFIKETSIPYFVHLHWHILNTTLPFFIYTIPAQDIWEKAAKQTFAGRKFLMMEPHHLLVYLCIHALHHSYEQESYFIDIAKVLDFYQRQLDWECLAEVARRWNADHALYFGLYLSSDIAGAEVPAAFLEKIKPKRFSNASNKVIKRILADKKGYHNLAYPIFLDMAGSWPGKIRFVFQTVFPPRQVLEQVYGRDTKSIFGLYVRKFRSALVQFFRLLGSFGRQK
ncbi:MAG: nucleotidyltransferase family protein [Candidatus Omnitrophica bacterium]|nr:nucleotidyltransferase family protein [Candidatus Omnitrophota bacterium]